MHYVYVLQSLNDKEEFYIGCSSDLKERLQSHNNGRNRSTKHSQWRLTYYEAYLNLSSARKREYRLKHHGTVKRHLMERIKASLEVE